MTILLIEVYTADTFVENLAEPLLIEYSASSFIEASGVNKHKVVAIDMRVEGDIEVWLKSSINCNDEVWAMCLSESRGNMEAIQKVFCNIKALFPEAMTIAYGYGISPIIDISIHEGEPGKVLAELVESSKQRDKKDFSEIAGISFFSDKGLKTTEQRVCINAENIPMRSITSRYRKNYTHCGKAAAWILSYQPFESSATKRKPDNVVKEILAIEEKTIIFSNRKKISDAKWLKELAEKLQSSGIRKKYHFTAEPTLVLANPHLLSLWKSIGLESVSLEETSDTSSSNSQNIKRATTLITGIGLERIVR